MTFRSVESEWSLPIRHQLKSSPRFLNLFDLLPLFRTKGMLGVSFGSGPGQVGEWLCLKETPCFYKGWFLKKFPLFFAKSLDIRSVEFDTLDENLFFP